MNPNSNKSNQVNNQNKNISLDNLNKIYEEIDNLLKRNIHDIKYPNENKNELSTKKTIENEVKEETLIQEDVPVIGESDEEEEEKGENKAIPKTDDEMIELLEEEERKYLLHKVKI